MSGDAVPNRRPGLWRRTPSCRRRRHPSTACGLRMPRRLTAFRSITRLKSARLILFPGRRHATHVARRAGFVRDGPALVGKSRWLDAGDERDSAGTTATTRARTSDKTRPDRLCPLGMWSMYGNVRTQELGGAYGGCGVVTLPLYGDPPTRRTGRSERRRMDRFNRGVRS